MDKKPIVFEMNSKDKLKYLDERVTSAKKEMLKFKHRQKKLKTVIIYKPVIVRFD